MDIDGYAWIWMSGISDIGNVDMMDGSVDEMCVVGPGEGMVHLGQPQTFP